MGLLADHPKRLVCFEQVCEDALSVKGLFRVCVTSGKHGNQVSCQLVQFSLQDLFVHGLLGRERLFVVGCHFVFLVPVLLTAVTALFRSYLNLEKVHQKLRDRQVAHVLLNPIEQVCFSSDQNMLQKSVFATLK